MHKNPPYEKWKDKAGVEKAKIGREAIQSLSRELQETLSQGLSVANKSRFDSALNALKLDDATKSNLLKDLSKDAPALPAPQAEKLVKRCFRRKVNTLRCLGQQVLLTVLDEVLPGVALAAAEAAGAAAAAAGAQVEAAATGKRRREEKRWRKRQEAAASGGGLTSVASAASAASATLADAGAALAGSDTASGNPGGQVGVDATREEEDTPAAKRAHVGP
mmetsp:Transcript_114901/g.245311  ORF Transcript_114901/g.245311 Transcript_114901/m.245311 type:complete len:220 (+) Transcript_114901:133-792(+)